MKRPVLAVLLLALVIPAQSQPRAPRAVTDLPRHGGPFYAPPPPDGPCDRREMVRLIEALLSKPPEPTIFECRPSTAWAVCQAVGLLNGNASRMHGILSDLESQMKICKRLGFGTSEP